MSEAPVIKRNPMPQIPIGLGRLEPVSKMKFKAFGGGSRGPNPIFTALIEKIKTSVISHTDKGLVIPVPDGWPAKRLKSTLESQLKAHASEREYQVKNLVTGELAVCVRDPAVPKRPGPGPRKAK